MEKLEIIINESKELLTGHPTTYNSIEQAVCDDIIKPILNELGWKSNPNFIIPKESNDEGKFPDYTLLKNKKKILIVEVKNMSVTPLDNPKTVKQIGDYCYSQSTDYGILTNGAEWLLYETFQKNKLDRIARQINLLKDDIGKCCNFLNYLRYEKIEDLKDETKKYKLLEETWQTILNDQNELIKPLIKALQNKLLASHPDNDFQQMELEDFVSNKTSELADTFLNIPNKTERRKEVLTSINHKNKVTSGMFEHEKDGIFHFIANPSIKIDVQKSNKELKKQLEENELFSKNVNGFRWKLRTRCGLL